MGGQLVLSGPFPLGPLTLGRVEELTEIAWKIRQAINAGYPEVDHIELFDQPIGSGGIRGILFSVLAKLTIDPPCGTGTSAKLACLAADRKLAEHEPWIQESILGSQFIGTYRWLDESQNAIIPKFRSSLHHGGVQANPSAR